MISKEDKRGDEFNKQNYFNKDSSNYLLIIQTKNLHFDNCFLILNRLPMHPTR